MNKIQKEKDLWVLLCLDILVAFLSLLAFALNWSIAKSPVAQFSAGLMPAVLIFLHALWTLGVKRGLSLVTLSAFLGWLFERVGLKYGVFGIYEYYLPPPYFFGIPVLIIIYWALFLYIGYAITSSFLTWLGLRKPSFRNGNWHWLIFLTMCDGVIVTAIDLFMDPIHVQLGSWAWRDGGAYFGIPLQNFAGWFFVTIVTTGIFRTYEYFYPKQLAGIPKTAFLIPLISYAAILILFIAAAFVLKLPGLIIFGSFTMLFVVSINFLFYEERAWFRQVFRRI